MAREPLANGLRFRLFSFQRGLALGLPLTEPIARL